MRCGPATNHSRLAAAPQCALHDHGRVTAIRASALTVVVIILQVRYTLLANISEGGAVKRLGLWLLVLGVSTVGSAAFDAQAAAAQAHMTPIQGPRLSLGGLSETPMALSAPLATMGESRPSTGTGQIVVGWIATGVGAVNLATLPICFADFYPADAEGLCVGLSVTLAVVGVSIGVPFLITGYNNRARYKRWRDEHPALAHLLNTQVSASDDGALVVYTGTL